jgi:TetR/AcrR family transcriptional repressor of lmrAB and yxaGH operons
MIAAALELFGRRGYHATAFSDVVEASGAPRGSIYFHFPGGKEELARAVALAAEEEIIGLCDAAAAVADSPGAYVQALATVVGDRLETSGYERGCAVATMVLELAPHVEAVQEVFRDCFARWRDVMAGHLAGWGMKPEQAHDAAVMIMSTLEGALLISRAMRSTDPLRAATEQLLLRLPAPRRTRSRTAAR